MDNKKEEMVDFLSPWLKKRVYKYLQTKPIVLVEHIILSYFTPEDKFSERIFTTSDVTMLLSLLKTSFPRKEVLPLIIDIEFYISTNGKFETKEIGNGYGIRKDVLDIIVRYLDTRPMLEVEGFLKMISSITINRPYLIEFEFKSLLDYLQSSCPRKDIKPIIELFREEEVLTKYGVEEKIKTPEPDNNNGI